MGVTQKKIAEYLDISQPQVAQALNGQPGVSAATRQRVLEAAKALGYSGQSNARARQLAALRHGKPVRTGTVAVLMGDFFEDLPLQKLPFFREILRGLHQEIECFDSHLATYYISRGGRLPDAVVGGGVDGILCLYSSTIEWELDKVSLSVPVVRLGGATPQWNLRPDDYQGIYDATRHLIELGHHRIAFAGDLERKFAIFAHDERLRGFRDAMQKSGLEVDEELLLHLDEPATHDGFVVMRNALQRGLNCSAVVCLNDLSALGVIQAAQQHGLRVPHELSVTGFDGLQGEFTPEAELTSVFFDREHMGRQAVRLIYESLSSPRADDEEPTRELLPVQLLIKNTTAPVCESALTA